jgi:hypothetical protein
LRFVPAENAIGDGFESKEKQIPKHLSAVQKIANLVLEMRDNGVITLL